MLYTDILFVLGAGLGGLIIGLFLFSQKKFNEAQSAAKAEKLVLNAAQEAKNTIEKAKVRWSEFKKQAEIERNEFSQQLERMGKMLETKISSNLKREEKLEMLKQTIQKEENNVALMRSQTGDLNKQMEAKLIQMTGLQKEQARQKLLSEYEAALKNDSEMKLQREIEWAQERAIRDGKNTLTEAIYRFSDPTSVEREHAKVLVSKDEIKGKIIGRGGRNIAFFEQLFGVDVVFNDEPNTILIGCFNLVQRQIAKFAMERLMREEVVNEEVTARTKLLAEQDMAKILKKEGEEVLKALEVKNMPPDFAKLVGRLKFRTSYGQNVLKHCFEVGYFARLLASEIGANVQIAWIGGIFHDIGKAVDQEVEGSHDVLTKEILEKFGFSPEIIHAAWTHHNAAPIETIEAKLVQAADAISAGRPGARAESLERYLEKIKELQDAALSFDGVKKAYAINAGREVRVIVDETKVDDPNVNTLASDIAAKVEEKGGYPGKIKITTIRVTKTADYAKPKTK